MKILVPEQVCTLPVFAASGLVIRNGEFFLVSDDEVSVVHGSLGNFTVTNLWKQELPEAAIERKKIKPDFESLFLDGDEIVILPSFSRDNRTKGARLSFNGQNLIDICALDFHFLYQKLQAEVPDLNIEGALRTTEGILLFQRGNGAEGKNAVILLDGLEGKIKKIIDIQLPRHGEVPLTMTDVTEREGEFWFSAVAEATESTYLDGEILGSYIGKMDQNFEVAELIHLGFRSKPEGLAFHPDGYLYLVTDDDSREVPSSLFRLRLDRSY